MVTNNNNNWTSFPLILDLKNVLRLSGSLERPMYDGLRVAKYPHDGTKFTSIELNMNRRSCPSIKRSKCITTVSMYKPSASLIDFKCWATTESTSTSMRLNSSKQHQTPDCHVS